MTRPLRGLRLAATAVLLGALLVGADARLSTARPTPTWNLAAEPQTTDTDGDGIRDDWEGPHAMVDWGPFGPQRGRPDLLVEFVRVEWPPWTPKGLDFTHSYGLVKEFFWKEGGIHLEWIETKVATPVSSPGFLGEEDADHFLSILNQTRARDDPFVTTVVLTPSHRQDGPTLVRGAGFIGGMLAVVDYGAHTDITFRPASSITSGAAHRDLVLSPVLERLVVGRVHAELTLAGYEAGASDGERVSLQPLPRNASIVEITWNPPWFATAPTARFADGSEIEFEQAGTSLRTRELASTIAHELGHTLGLCHAHESACYGGFPRAQRLMRDNSTMSYVSPKGLLNFLPIEWSNLRAAHACVPAPKTEPRIDSQPTFLESDVKYRAGFEGSPFGRACNGA